MKYHRPQFSTIKAMAAPPQYICIKERPLADLNTGELILVAVLRPRSKPASIFSQCFLSLNKPDLTREVFW